jgi:TatD DNase family protein
VVAVGECGFDFHYLDGISPEISEQLKQNPHRFAELLSKGALEQIENQKYWWLEQWKLAQRYNLPLIIHTRDAREATLDFMQENNINRCVMHCFSEDSEFACELLEFSDEIYFSFSGILTYKKSEKIQEAAKNIPLSRILVETDAPFLAPQTVRGQVNEPANTRYTLEKLAELRGVQVGDIEDRVYENSLRFYGLE